MTRGERRESREPQRLKGERLEPIQEVIAPIVKKPPPSIQDEVIPPVPKRPPPKCPMTAERKGQTSCRISSKVKGR